MKIRKKIIKIGKSSGIVIDKGLMMALRAKTGDEVEIEIKKIYKKSK